LQTFLSDGTAVHAAVADCVAETRDIEAILNAASDAALELCKPASPDRPAMLSRYIERITLRDGSVEIAIRRASLLPDGKSIAANATNAANAMNADPILLEAETARVRRGHEVRLIIPSKASEKPIERDTRLVDLLAEAHAARSLLMASTDASIDQLAKRQGRCRTHFARLIKLSYLAPDIVTMVLEGRQPASLNRRKLMVAELPHRWADQRAMLGCN
jgi:hypothetical protein